MKNGRGIESRKFVHMLVWILAIAFIVPDFTASIAEDSRNTAQSLPLPETILSTSFEKAWVLDADGDYLAPPGWDVDGICKSHQLGLSWATHYWSDLRNDECYYYLSHSGMCSACVWWSDGYGEPSFVGIRQNEWLITPELNFSRYASINLTFWSIYYWNQSCENYDYVKVSTDGGETWETVADLVHEERWRLGGEDYGWREWNHYEEPVVIDLSKYAGEPSVKIAWNYNFPGEEEGLRAIWVIDDVKVEGMPDTSAPTVSIEKPKDGIYLNDIKLFSLIGTIIIGKVNITVNASDNVRISRVEFFVNGELKHVDRTSPYTWMWDEMQFGRFELEVKVIDGAGNQASEKISVWKFF